MKPVRIKMTHELISKFELLQKMHSYIPHEATREEMQAYHSKDYINFLESVKMGKKDLIKKTECKLD
jgi:histone deacetylase 1/2